MYPDANAKPEALDSPVGFRWVGECAQGRQAEAAAHSEQYDGRDQGGAREAVARGARVSTAVTTKTSGAVNAQDAVAVSPTANDTTAEERRSASRECRLTSKLDDYGSPPVAEASRSRKASTAAVAARTGLRIASTGRSASSRQRKL
ncbi:hypothetical protein AB0F91_35150 [Amycolatopsis sp. NPDC023774]|uniref:hypothetical protein n=1 Tax=Amycolatopsis sp. NPDC023774 TaxID=3155015 RepID=UPI0033D3ED6C